MQCDLGGARLVCVGLFLLGAARPAEAERQGALGAVSQGRVGISVSIADSVRVSALADVAVRVLESDNADTRARRFCLWSTAGPKPYKVTAYGSGRSGAFTLGGPARPDLPYIVRWRDRPVDSATPISIEARPLAKARGVGAERMCTESFALAFHPAPRQAVGNAGYAGYLTIIAAPD